MSKREPYRMWSAPQIMDGSEFYHGYINNDLYRTQLIYKEKAMAEKMSDIEKAIWKLTRTAKTVEDFALIGRVAGYLAESEEAMLERNRVAFEDFGGFDPSKKVTPVFVQYSNGSSFPMRFGKPRLFPDGVTVEDNPYTAARECGMPLVELDGRVVAKCPTCDNEFHFTAEQIRQHTADHKAQKEERDRKVLDLENAKTAVVRQTQKIARLRKELGLVEADSDDENAFQQRVRAAEGNNRVLEEEPILVFKRRLYTGGTFECQHPECRTVYYRDPDDPIFLEHARIHGIAKIKIDMNTTRLGKHNG